MTLEEIRSAVEARAIYPLVHCTEENGAIMVVLETHTPDGAPAVSSFALSRAMLDAAVAPQAMLDTLVDDACGGLQRYLASFKPPAWDEIRWGP